MREVGKTCPLLNTKDFEQVVRTAVCAEVLAQKETDACLTDKHACELMNAANKLAVALQRHAGDLVGD
jgi:hypothetical protein